MSIAQGDEKWSVSGIKIDEENNIGIGIFGTAYSLSEYNREVVLEILSTFRFTETETTVDTSDWKTFTHNKYKFSIKYDEGDEFEGGAPGVSEQEYNKITVHDGIPSQTEGFLTVHILDPNILDNDTPTEMKNAYNLDINTYMEEVRDIIQKENNDSGTITKSVIGPVTNTSIDGIDAKQFTLTGGYSDHSGGFTLGRMYTFIFVEDKNNLKFLIYYPTSNEHLQSVLSTFKFAD